MPYTGHFAPTQGITPMHARAFQGVVDLLNPLAQVAAGNSVPQRIGNADYSKLITAATNIANYATENGRYEDHDAPAQLQDNYVRITEGFHRGASFDVTYHTPKRKITLAERKAPARPGRGSMKIGHSAFEVRDSRTVGKGDDTIHTRFSYDLPRPGFVRGRWINLSFSDAAIRRSTLLGNLMDTDGINLNPHSCLFIFSLL